MSSNQAFVWVNRTKTSASFKKRNDDAEARLINRHVQQVARSLPPRRPDPRRPSSSSTEEPTAPATATVVAPDATATAPGPGRARDLPCPSPAPTARAPRLLPQPPRANFDVVDPFRRSAMAGKPLAGELLTFYRGFSPLESQVLADAVRSEAVLTALLTYSATIMRALQIGPVRHQDVYSLMAQSLALVGRQIQLPTLASLETTVEALVWLSCKSLFKRDFDLTRTHLAGIRSLLSFHRYNTRRLPFRVQQMLVYCDLTSVTSGRIPLFEDDFLLPPEPPAPAPVFGGVGAVGAGRGCRGGYGGRSGIATATATATTAALDEDDDDDWPTRLSAIMAEVDIIASNPSSSLRRDEDEVLPLLSILLRLTLTRPRFQRYVAMYYQIYHVYDTYMRDGISPGDSGCGSSRGSDSGNGGSGGGSGGAHHHQHQHHHYHYPPHVLDLLRLVVFRAFLNHALVSMTEDLDSPLFDLVLVNFETDFSRAVKRGAVEAEVEVEAESYFEVTASLRLMEALLVKFRSAAAMTPDQNRVLNELLVKHAAAHVRMAFKAPLVDYPALDDWDTQMKDGV